MITVIEARDRCALSFSSGGVVVREADLIVGERLRAPHWVLVSQMVVEQNLLQACTNSSSTSGVPDKPVLSRVPGAFEMVDDGAMPEFQRNVPIDDQVKTLIDIRS